MAVKKALYMLGQLTDADTEWLFKVGKKQKLEPGEVLIKEGEPINALYIALTGTLGVTAGKSNTPINQLFSGEVVGEISFVDSRPPVATVSALDRAIVLAIPRAELQQRIDQDGMFAGRFFKAIAMFLSDKMRDAVGMLGYGDVPDETDELDDTLADEMMDTVYLAGLRFERLLKQVIDEK